MLLFLPGTLSPHSLRLPLLLCLFQVSAPMSLPPHVPSPPPAPLALLCPIRAMVTMQCLPGSRPSPTAVSNPRAGLRGSLSKCSFWTGDTGISRKLVKNAGSQAPPQTYCTNLHFSKNPGTVSYALKTKRCCFPRVWQMVGLPQIFLNQAFLLYISVQQLINVVRPAGSGAQC